MYHCAVISSPWPTISSYSSSSPGNTLPSHYITAPSPPPPCYLIPHLFSPLSCNPSPSVFFSSFPSFFILPHFPILPFLLLLLPLPSPSLNPSQNFPSQTSLPSHLTVLSCNMASKCQDERCEPPGRCTVCWEIPEILPGSSMAASSASLAQLLANVFSQHL